MLPGFGAAAAVLAFISLTLCLPDNRRAFGKRSDVMSKKTPSATEPRPRDKRSVDTGSVERTVAEQAPRAGDHETHDPLPGRQLEIAALLALVQRALVPSALTNDDLDVLKELRPESPGDSVSSIACVQGGGGTGKSRLLGEVRSFAMRREIKVKEVYCHERQGIPFLPILRVVKELIAESVERKRLWQKHGVVLSRVFPEIAAELGDVHGSPGLPGDDGKIQLFDALTGIL